MSGFVPRLTRPEVGNKYYITKSAGGWSDALVGSPTDKACNVLHNCVGYAYGRFNEIVGEGACKYLRPVNAEQFMAVKGGLESGMEPRLGACMVWQKGATLKGADGAGHVAIVEQIISSTEIVTSESRYGASKPFWTQRRKKADGNWEQGAGYKFLGFIYNPAVEAAEKGSASKMGFTNSPLVSYTRISPNRTPDRNHAIDTISIHCVVGQCSVETLGNIFASTAKQASSNYGIGPDGRIGMYVEEKDRSWCTGGTMRVNGISGSSNDYQAVTIEVASDMKHPYAITDKAMAALIELCADICRRNGIRQLLWKGDKSLVGCVSKQNLTVHRWFANKACPGDYIYSRLGDIAAKVNAKLGAAGAAPATIPGSSVPYRVKVEQTGVSYRTGPGTNCNPAGTIKPGVYTIVSEATGAGATLWGKLKSGAGWIALDYAKKV